MDLELTLPNPNVLCSNNYQASMEYSSLIPSPGFTNKYDPEGEYIAIGCNGGEKVLYSVAESLSSF